MMENIIPTVILAASCGLAALGVTVWRRVHGYRRSLRRAVKRGAPDAAGSQPEFALTRYQPLFRLLSGSDADFLREHRNCPKAARRWEDSQRRVARLYLMELAADFQALHRQARIAVAHSPEHAHLLPALFKKQVTFWRALIWIEIRLATGTGGAARISAAELCGAFEAVRKEISRAATTQDQLA